MKKIKLKLFLIFISIVLLGVSIYFIPKDTYKMSKSVQIFQINNNPINLENIKVSFNIPIPEEIKIKMEKEQKEKEELKRQEELKKQEEEKLKQEKQKKQLEIAKQKEIQTTSRSLVENRENSDGEYIQFTATGYCPCNSCCGKTTGITASGAKAQSGVTVAMSSKYSFGTQIQIKGMGSYIVQDRGGAIQGNKIDIFFNTHQEALNFGRKTVYLKIL